MAQKARRLNEEWLNFKSKSSMDYPLIINTAGYCDVRYLFETFNPAGRADYYLIYIVEGELTLDIDCEKHTAKRGSAIIFPPKCSYKYSGKEHLFYFFAHFTGSYATDFFKECGFDKLPCIIENDFNTDTQKRFDLLVNTFLHNEKLSIQRCACLLQEILLDICLDASSKTKSSPINASLEYIHSFFTETINIPYLAGLENLSNSRYVTVFKEHMGKSPSEYIIELRLQLAKNMLDSTNMSIKQISKYVGYNDQYFFSRIFKKYLGISPQKYRSIKLSQ